MEESKHTGGEGMDWIHAWIGSDAYTITWWQMSIRGTLIFFYALFLIRFGGTRIFGKGSSFDIVVGVILGSILSRALTANARFFPTLAAAGTLVLLHLLLSRLSLKSKRLGHLIKGVEVKLIEDGKILREGMNKTDMTEHDLMEALRLKNTESVRHIKSAFMERNGKVSVIKA
jgi:uncharacterized membrane protein YcaP (DUF421 family)